MLATLLNYANRCKIIVQKLPSSLVSISLKTYLRANIINLKTIFLQNILMMRL